MEERKKKPHIPSNYVSLLQRREWWLQQQQQQNEEERETQGEEVKIGGENESQSENHQQQKHELQQQEERVRERNEEEEEKESVAVSVTDDLGGNEKGRPRKNNNRKKKKKEKEIEIMANGEKNEGEEEKEERVERQNTRHVYVVKGKREGQGGFGMKVGGGDVKVGRESANVVGETGPEGEVEKVGERQVWRGKTERVVSRRNVKKRDTQVELRPKVRDSVERKSDNVAERDGWEMEVERNIDAENIGVECEQDGMVEGSGLTEEVARKFSSVSVDEESERHMRLAYVVKREKESAGSQRNGRKSRKSTKQLQFRPKIRDLVEESNAAMVIEQKSDSLTAESCLVAEVERNVEGGKVGKSHVTRAYVVKGRKETVAPRRGRWKRDAQLEFRPKGRNLDEGYNSYELSEQELENIVEESTQKAENDRNMEDEKIGIECEEDAVVGETNLTEKVEQKLGGCSADEERERSRRSNGVERNSRLGSKGYGGYNREYSGGQRRFGRGNGEYYGYNWYHNRKNLCNSGGNGRTLRGVDAPGGNYGRVWVKKVEAAIVDDVAVGQTPSVLTNELE